MPFTRKPKVVEIPKTNAVANNHRMKTTCIYFASPITFSPVPVEELAAREFMQYDIVVWGPGLAKATHPDYAKTAAIAKAIRTRNPFIELFGSVSIGLTPGMAYPGSNIPMNELKSIIDEWIAIGATGMLLNDYSYESLTPRDRQNEIVDYCHNRGINVIATGWNLNYVFSKNNMYLDWVNFYGNPNQLDSSLNENDYFLFDDMFYRAGNTGQQEVSYQGAHQQGSRPYDAVYYYQHLVPELNMSYYDKFKTKTMSVCRWANSATWMARDRFYFRSILMARVLNMDAHAMTTENWGIDKKFVTFPYPKLSILEDAHIKHHIQTNRIGQNMSYDNAFEAYIGTEHVRFMWQRHTVAGNEGYLWGGIHDVYVNEKRVENRDNLEIMKIPGFTLVVKANQANVAVSCHLERVDGEYVVVANPSWNTTWWITEQTMESFVINFGTPPTVDSDVWWMLIR